MSDTPPFLVAGLDSGATSGIALVERGLCDTRNVLFHDTLVSNWGRREKYAASCAKLAEQRGAHLVVVYEKFFGRPHTIRGAARSVGKWLHCFEAAGVHPTRCVEVQVNDWRRDVYGLTKIPRGIGTDEWKRRAVALVFELYGLTVDHDAAEAILIGAWGHTAKQVLARVPKRRRR